jgi:cytoskeletal protein CcmA (bactofilin family)
MRRSLILLLVLIGTLGLAAAVNAQTPPGGAQSPARKFRSGDTVTIAQGETVAHDLYVSAGTVQIDGRIDGDLIVAGGTVTVNGPVNGNLIAAGGNLTLNGEVAGDLFAGGGTVITGGNVRRSVRVGGGQVTVGSQVGRDLLVGAGTLTLAQSARVAGDLIFGTGQTNLNGTVDGSVLGQTSQYSKTGTVRGTDEVTIQEPREQEERREPTVADRILDQLRRYVTILVAGGLLLWLAPRLFRGAAALVEERPLPSLGYGVLTIAGWVGLLIALVIAVVVLAIVLGLLGLGGLLGVSVVAAILSGGVSTFLVLTVAIFVADAIVGFALARWLQGRFAAGAAWPAFALLALGVLIVVLVTWIPILGGLIQLLAALVGLGALVYWLWERLRPGRVLSTEY